MSSPTSSAGKGAVRIASFNVNSVRVRLDIILGWLAAASPDVLCLQETKVTDDKFPAAAFEEAGYGAVFSGEKTYNGVAILSALPLTDVRMGFDDEGLWSTRLISAAAGGVTVVNAYAPQGSHPSSPKFSEKLEWFGLLHDWFDRNFRPADPVVWAGDFNIAPEPRDVYDPAGLAGQVGFHPDEHAVLARLRAWGFVDVFRLHEPGEAQYTFFDYRLRGGVRSGLGWRVDHIWATRPVASRSTRAWIDLAPRLLERPSDHTPIVADFDL